MSLRKPVSLALFALGQGLTWSVNSGPAQTFASSFRQVKLWDDPGANLPMLCQGERTEVIKSVRQGMPPVRVWMYDWLIYFNPPTDSDAVPADTTNAILDQIDALFPDEDSAAQDLGIITGQTLGGLVHRVNISGKITKWQGDLGGVALILVPIAVTVP